MGIMDGIIILSNKQNGTLNGSVFDVQKQKTGRVISLHTVSELLPLSILPESMD